ncbi:MAG: hypothetical protein ABW352_10555 [Polyangiales bacterium]
MRRRSSWLWLLLLAACDDGDSAPASDANLDASVTITCSNNPDAATALGVRGNELWQAFEGTYTVPANRPRSGSLEPATFTVTVTRTQTPTPGLTDCSQVSVPVLVSVQSSELAVNENIVGVLRGSLYSADVAFATSEYLLGLEPRVFGSLVFHRGQPLQMRLRTDAKGSWVAPPLQEKP